jgi:hypothetical protein
VSPRARQNIDPKLLASAMASKNKMFKLQEKDRGDFIKDNKTANAKKLEEISKTKIKSDESLA